ALALLRAVDAAGQGPGRAWHPTREREEQLMATTTTASMVAPVLAHLVSLVDAGAGYRPMCSCGWSGDRADTTDAARAAGVEHTAEAVGPADHMDRLMSELLDLQD